METVADRALMTTIRVLLRAGELARRGTTDERGATAVEYGLLVSLIAGVIVLAVTALGLKVNGAFTSVTALVP